MARVQLITTGVMEERALGRSLRRLFPEHDFVSRPRIDGFTSAPLPPELFRPAPAPLNLDLDPPANPASRWCTAHDRQGHPKRYLIYLTATESNAGGRYRESEHGASALAELDWWHVTRRPAHTRFARSLLADLEDMLGPPKQAGRTLDDAHPLTWPPPRDPVLRNL